MSCSCNRAPSCFFWNKKDVPIVYASMSSSNPSPSSTSSWYLFSKATEIYLRKINPMITFLYSDAGICPHNTHAASHSYFSNPIFALVLSAIILFPQEIILSQIKYYNFSYPKKQTFNFIYQIYCSYRC